ncbi:MAG: NAD-dependent epimerase/dehydratase family protein [Nanoarchaeota archaeon]
MKKILISGATGFIGKHLVRKLLKQDNIEYLHLVDDLSNSNTIECIDILSDKKISFFETDVFNFRDNDVPYDQIYHLASPVGPAGVLKYAGKMGKIIVSDTIKMADLALKNNAKLLAI